MTDSDQYDIFSAEFRNTPYPLWNRMQAGCPVAHTTNTGGSYMVARYDDVRAIARNPADFSSRSTEVGGDPAHSGGLILPPITSDPPAHQGHRDLLMPFFHPKQVAELEPFIRGLARPLAEELAARGGGDANADFAQRLTISVLAHLLEVPAEMEDTFIDWTIRLLRLGPLDQQVRTDAVREMIGYFDALLRERATGTGDDLISYLARADLGDLDDTPMGNKIRIGSSLVVMIAGADTTWSALSASLFHLGTVPADRRRLIAEPGLMTSAVEELLRVYAPVMLARVTTSSLEVCGRPVPEGSRVLLPLAGANRDPEVFDDPDTVQLDRRRNRHLTFGTGPHRCLGSPLARLELRVALEEWLRVIPDYQVEHPDSIEWSGGSVRGPQTVPFIIS